MPMPPLAETIDEAFKLEAEQRARQIEAVVRFRDSGSTARCPLRPDAATPCMDVLLGMVCPGSAAACEDMIAKREADAMAAAAAGR